MKLYRCCTFYICVFTLQSGLVSKSVSNSFYVAAPSVVVVWGNIFRHNTGAEALGSENRTDKCTAKQVRSEDVTQKLLKSNLTECKCQTVDTSVKTFCPADLVHS